MVHHNLVVKGPLFPLFPEGWEGPQAGRGTTGTTQTDFEGLSLKVAEVFEFRLERI